MPHTLRTDRLTLRPLALRDGEALSRAVNDRAVLRNTGTWVFPAPADYARYRIRSAMAMDPQETQIFGIHVDGVLAGSVGIHHQVGRQYEIGYMLGRAWWGRGFATEAARAICVHAFRTLPVTTIFGGVFSDNLGSIRVLEKIGFQVVERDVATWSIVRNGHAPGTNLHLIRERMRP